MPSLTNTNCYVKQDIFSLIIWSVYQLESRFPFTTTSSVLNHVGAITLKRQNGPICKTESHKTVYEASVLSLTNAHGPLKSERWKCTISMCTFQEKMRLWRHKTFLYKNCNSFAHCPPFKWINVMWHLKANPELEGIECGRFERFPDVR